MASADLSNPRKRRGAYYTPPGIAEFLVGWALQGRESDGVVLDPSCGEGVFLSSAQRRMRPERTGPPFPRLYGVDVDDGSLAQARSLLGSQESAEARLLSGNFFQEPLPSSRGSRIPLVDAVVGNPPFVRYQTHRGDAREHSFSAALAQGVRLSGLASSWAAMLVHSSAFLKDDGRLAMVVPAELLSVGYAEPVRLWLRRRFRVVHLVVFDRLQFVDAEEQVVLLVARGSGGCSAFNLHHVEDASDLENLHIFDSEAFTPREEGKWTDLLLPEHARKLLSSTMESHFTAVGSYGTVELGTVTGRNKFFTISEMRRRDFELAEEADVVRTVPAGTRHVRGIDFSEADWERLRVNGERVWLLRPQTDVPIGGLARYIELGEEEKVDQAYKCSIRKPWWRPFVQPAPDLFFTYMSDTAPRMVLNSASMTFLNSMHGVRLAPGVPPFLKRALPVLALNTVTMLAAEVLGRAYGGGILKMEPKEATQLPVPILSQIRSARNGIQGRFQQIDSLVRAGKWTLATNLVDQVVLVETMGMPLSELEVLRTALRVQRVRRRGISDS